jgi:hypothetical protein
MGEPVFDDRVSSRDQYELVHRRSQEWRSDRYPRIGARRDFWRLARVSGDSEAGLAANRMIQNLRFVRISAY